MNLRQACDELYDAFYPQNTRARDILERHSRSVAALAADINRRRESPVDPQLLEAAAMLHDIGIFLTNAPSIDCHGCLPYMMHGVLGADLLRRHGFPEEIARVAERHTGTGLYPADIATSSLPFPRDRVLYPETRLERLVCYADKFYSKSRDMSLKSLERVRASLARHGADALQRFEALREEFGNPL